MSPQYRNTKETRAEAKIFWDYQEGRRSDLPGFTSRIYLEEGYIKKTRKALNLTQRAFADLLRVQLITVQSWEQGQRQPDNTAAILLQLLGKHKPVQRWLLELMGSPKVKARLAREKKPKRKARGPIKAAPGRTKARTEHEKVAANHA
jgi:DNA-binding transcriptional regulator YiaG